MTILRSSSITTAMPWYPSRRAIQRKWAAPTKPILQYKTDEYLGKLVIQAMKWKINKFAELFELWDYLLDYSGGSSNQISKETCDWCLYIVNGLNTLIETADQLSVNKNTVIVKLPFQLKMVSTQRELFLIMRIILIFIL